MLRDKDDPSRITYSFTLFERRDGANLVRVQTDSVDQPFDINRGARLNLGSTAKLRTVITYLQIVAALHERYGAMSAAQLRDVKPDRQDALTRWALDYLAHTSDRSLRAMLDAAIERKYSASPGETFYTGGGAQAFNNFESSDNGAHPHRASRVPAFGESGVRAHDARHRALRDGAASQGRPREWLDDPATRRTYLTRFADPESRVYMTPLLQEVSPEDGGRGARAARARRAQVAAQDRDGAAQRGTRRAAGLVRRKHARGAQGHAGGDAA